jgi:superfamily II DNA helicase RecQ
MRRADVQRLFQGAASVARTDRAREQAVAPFIVMHDRTLEGDRDILPRTIAELGDVPGIGRRNCQRAARQSSPRRRSSPRRE